MSTFLQFNCLIHDDIARKAIENYMGILQEAFQQYQNLWEKYIKLQEKYEHECNVHSSFQVIDKPCTKIKDELLTPQRQLNDDIIAQEENISLLELDTLNIGSVNLKFNIEDNPSLCPKESPCEDIGNESPSKSPVFFRKCPRIGGISVKKFARSPKAALICNNLTSDMNIHCDSKKVLSKFKKKLEISTSQHVETTFLADGRRLKQSRLVFHPINEKTESLNVQKHKPDSILPKIEQKSIEDISLTKAFITTKSDITDTNEISFDVTKISPTQKNITSKIMKNNVAETNESFEDIIEISPTQRNVTSKITHRLRLKRKTSAIKSSLSKHKRRNPVSNVVPKIMIDNIDFALCSSPEHTPIEIEDNKLLVENMTNTVVNTLKDKNNVSNLSPAKICNETNVQIKKEDKSIIKVQNIAEKKNAFIHEDENFCLPAEIAINKNDTNDFNLYDIENKPPAKKAPLAEFDILPRKKENVLEQINMRCKADRAKLNGWDCWECEEYYKNLLLSKDELQKRKNQCSRHRHKYERPNTPEGFWDPEFPETLSNTYRQNKI